MGIVQLRRLARSHNICCLGRSHVTRDTCCIFRVGGLAGRRCIPTVVRPSQKQILRWLIGCLEPMNRVVLVKTLPKGIQYMSSCTSRLFFVCNPGCRGLELARESIVGVELPGLAAKRDSRVPTTDASLTIASGVPRSLQ